LAISVAESLDDQLMPSLQCGDLDIVFGPLAGVFPAANDIIEVALFTDPLGLAVSPKSTVARRKSVSLNELKDAKWVLPGPGSAYRRQIEALFATTGLSWPTDCITTNSLTLTEYLITHSDRVSIVSRMQTVLFNAWHIRRVRLKGVGSRTIGVKWRKSMQLSPLAEQLLHAAREVSRADEALHGER
jgi:DNA-binding transcriptional LysR family regulator